MDLPRAYNLERDVLAAQVEVVRATIDHRGEKGRVLESYVTRFLRDALPQQYGITTGFIAFPPRARGGVPTLSGQLDIIIYDALHGSPLMRLPTCDVLPLEAVFAYVEVKARLSGKTGESSVFGCVRQAQQVRQHTRRFFLAGTDVNSASVVRVDATSVRSYVFAFDGPRNADVQLRRAAERLGSLAELSGLFINARGFYRSRPNASPEVDHAPASHALATFRHAVVHDLARFDRWPGTVIPLGGKPAKLMTAYLDHYLPVTVRRATGTADRSSPKHTASRSEHGRSTSRPRLGASPKR